MKRGRESPGKELPTPPRLAQECKVVYLGRQGCCCEVPAGRGVCGGRERELERSIVPDEPQYCVHSRGTVMSAAAALTGRNDD